MYRKGKDVGDGNDVLPADVSGRVLRQLARRGYLDFGFATSAKTLDKGLLEAGENDTLEAGIRRLQARYGLPQTGKIDLALLAFLEQPYCDLPDPKGPPSMLSGGIPWASPKLTYQFMSWPGNFTKTTIRDAMRTACKTWEDACAVRFSEVSAQGDMRIVFAAGDHGDEWPFDGTGRILGHAFYPDWPSNLRGDIHLDTDETWVIDASAALPQHDLITTMIHEIGHTIGLPHFGIAESVESVMWPNYVGPRRELYDHDAKYALRLYPKT